MTLPSPKIRTLQNLTLASVIVAALLARATSAHAKDERPTILVASVGPDDSLPRVESELRIAGFTAREHVVPAGTGLTLSELVTAMKAHSATSALLVRGSQLEVYSLKGGTLTLDETVPLRSPASDPAVAAAPKTREELEQDTHVRVAAVRVVERLRMKHELELQGASEDPWATRDGVMPQPAIEPAPTAVPVLVVQAPMPQPDRVALSAVSPHHVYLSASALLLMTTESSDGMHPGARITLGTMVVDHLALEGTFDIGGRETIPDAAAEFPGAQLNGAPARMPISLSAAARWMLLDRDAVFQPSLAPEVGLLGLFIDRGGSFLGPERMFSVLGYFGGNVGVDIAINDRMRLTTRVGVDLAPGKSTVIATNSDVSRTVVYRAWTPVFGSGSAGFQGSF